jgi:hypothetical protein
MVTIDKNTIPPVKIKASRMDFEAKIRKSDMDMASCKEMDFEMSLFYHYQ